ncbi:armadillo-type protein [Lentinula raphanica]|uniref:Armadillo-type protein n=1 Tax=Lentinula raphanica TaxID=153919 RepID=A0AA38PBF9_9AGAR|nr:armadillo-type protein [Lentinula raphanica]
MSTFGSSIPLSDEPPPTSTSNNPDNSATMNSTLSARPTHITMPPSPFSNINISYTPSPSHRLDDPFESPMFSPALVFYTAPSTPIVESPASQAPAQLQSQVPHSPPLTPVTHIAIPHVLAPSSQSPFSIHTPPNPYPPTTSYPSPGPVPSPETILPHPSPLQTTDDAFPEPSEPPDDTSLNDEGLNTLERIYLYARSKSSFHRVFVASALPELLEQVTPHEAIEYVLPLLTTLATDEDEMVKEAFSSKLVSIIWWFFTHCQLVPGDIVDENSLNPPKFLDHEGIPTISVQAFTPILGTLLLSPNVLVGGATRYAVVALLGRIKRVNDYESKIGSNFPTVRVQNAPPLENSHNLSAIAFSESDDEDDIVIGLFGKEERVLVEKEILFQVVVGMGRLESEDALEEQGQNASTQHLTESAVEQETQETPRLTLEPQVEIIVDEDDSSPFQQPSQGFQILSPQREVPEPDKPLFRSETKQLSQTNNPYFPSLPSSAYVAPSKVTSSGSPMSTSSSGSSSSTPSSTTDTSTSGSEASISPHSNPSLRTSHSSSDSTVTTLSPSPSSSLADVTPLARSSSPRPHQADTPMSSIEGTYSPNFNFLLQQDRNAHGELRLSPSNISDVPSYEASEMDEGECDQAAIGRLSSMSLMAAVAASGYLDNEYTNAFVSEIERVSQDTVFWVRREACFALGALAKVVPEEMVQLILMPTLQNLVSDPVHHVRHSSLFALPTILGRLPLKQRRQMALEIMIPMSMDEWADVRAGVLEALGEVIYTFHEEGKPEIVHDFAETEMKESQTPPEELLKMFLGRTQDRRVIDGQQPLGFEEEQVKPTPRMSNKREALEAFYTDPTRPLICAFNFPAVTLTVGRLRWSSALRDTYLWLADSSIPGVKRTLAASLGEMAKILGKELAQQDLLPVWHSAFSSPEDDVRLKLVDCLVPFVIALPRDGQLEVFRTLLDAWASGVLTSWREREGIAKSLNDLLNIDSSEVMDIVMKLLFHALADAVNTVRTAAISILPNLWMTFKDKNFLEGLRIGFLSLARSETSRRRMTYIACHQALLLPRPEGTGPSMELDDELCRTLSSLAFDPIVGVRIGVARIIESICAESRKNAKFVPSPLLDVIPVLSQDSSHEVRSYVANCLSPSANSYQGTDKVRSVSTSLAASNFSKPPPTRTVMS